MFARKWVALLFCLGVLIPAGWILSNDREEREERIPQGKNQIIWRLGLENNSSMELGSYSKARTEAVDVPNNWNKRSDWSLISKGLKGDVNPNMQVFFELSSVPEYGAELSFKVVNAHKAVPQMGVWSNDTMVGLIQIAGVGGTSSPFAVNKSYQVYIPKEFLQTGSNVLKLSTVRCMWCSEAEDPFLWWEWDFLKLIELSSPANEPLHGRYVNMGTLVAEGDFGYTENVVRHLPAVLKWLGIAYSGNIMRASFWTDVDSSQWQETGLKYMQTLRDFNMGIVADHQNTAFELTENQMLPDEVKRNLNQFFDKYGSLIQYYEVDNEPGLFNRSKAVNIAIADYVNANKPKHVKTVAPGWAYWPTGGQPDGWERDPSQRMEVEQKTQLTNGHSYGLSYADDEGGSFIETLKTLNVEQDGSAKEMLVTETGTSDAHIDDPSYGSSQPHASVFDRILRAHVGFADYFMQHAAFFPEYGLFSNNFDWSTHDPADTAMYPGISKEDARLKTYRRLALAYATHGAPLPYHYLNKPSIAGKKVYFRAVNTAKLQQLPGSKAVSDKILLNFINFEPSVQTMNVRITMPEKAFYEGERIGAGQTYATASTYVQKIWAQATLDLSVTLEPGEAVQYILIKK